MKIPTLTLILSLRERKFPSPSRGGTEPALNLFQGWGWGYFQMNTMTLKVREALPKDVGRAIARIDPEDMKELGIEVGEIIEIEGKRKTPVKIMPCYAEERGKKIVQIDGITRENAKAGVDEKVTIKKVGHRPARRV